MKPFSKKADWAKAICPTCGEYGTTNLSPEEIKQKGWECADCANKRLKGLEEKEDVETPKVLPVQTPADPTPPTERGSKEISKYDPEYQFLVKLVKLVTAEGVPPQELKALAEANPFVTVDDVGNLAAKIWTLATEKYQIPREWLIKRLPKNAKKADLWPSQKETQDMLSHEHNSLSYNNDQEPDLSVSGPRPDEVEVESKTKKLNISKVIEIFNAKEPKVVNIDMKNHSLQFSDGSTLSFDEAIKKAMELDKTATGEFTGAEFSGTDAQPNPLTDIGPYSSPEDHGKKPQKSPFPNTNWLPADDENLDQQPASNVAASLNKKAYDEGYWIDPSGKVYQVRNKETGFITHDEWIAEHMEMLHNEYGLDITKQDIDDLPPRDLNNLLIESGWTRIGDSGNADIGIRTKDLRKIPRIVEDTLYSFYSGGEIALEDLNGKHVEIKKLDQDLQKTVNQSLMVHASLSKLALAQQDVVDFYLLSLLPPEYLTQEVGPEHYDALGIFKTVIQSLRDEYIERGLHELKEEAETTKWTKAVPDSDMPEQLKPYYTYHDEPFNERNRRDRDDEDSEPEFPYNCYECGAGLYEDDAYSFGDYTYCESCQGDAINKAIQNNVSYCETHHVFLNADSDLDDYLTGMDIAVADPREHPAGPEHKIVRYREGQDIWREVQDNARKQLEFKIRERKERKLGEPKQLKLRPDDGTAPNQLGGDDDPNPGPTASLKQAAVAESGWWEAPDNFDDYTAQDFYNIFQYAKWKHLYGGPLRAEVARTIVEMEKTTDWQKLVVLIDHFHDLGNNTGKLLDKFPEWHKWFKKLLDMKAEKNSLRYLLPKASGPVKNLVTEFLQTHGRSWREDEEGKTQDKEKPISADGWEVGEEVLVENANSEKQRFTPATIIAIVDPANYSSPFKVRHGDIEEWVSANQLKTPQFSVSSLKRPFSKKAAGDNYKNVLIVCEGNTCRSPMAENILRSIRPDLNIISRGLSATSAFQMSPDAVEVLKEKNIPVQPHTSQQITKEDIGWADLIIAMSHYMEEDLAEFYPESNGKVVTLRDADISDPVGGDIAKYRAVRDEISESLGVMASMKKQANPQTRYWIAPDGKEFDAGTHHGIWVNTNPEVLKKYGITPPKDKYDMGRAWDDMINSGWVRVSNEPKGNGFSINIANTRNIPVFMDDFIARNFKQGDIINVGESNNDASWVQISDPFPSIQKAVNRQLMQSRSASLKKADVSGKVANDILRLLQTSGGVTYNLQKGNLAGSNMFAVSIYPDREQIQELGSFEDIDNFIQANMDLLSDPSNSFGAWVHEGKVYLDVVVTIPDRDKAVELAREHNQLAIFDLATNKEIPVKQTVRAFSKKAAEDILTQDEQNAVAAASSPAYVIALNNYAQAVKRGHSKDRALEYAIESVDNLAKIDEKKLVEFINTYVK